MDFLAPLTDFLNGLQAWHWLALGAVLLAIEIASTTSYLLWPGIAALAVGALNFLLPGLAGPLSVFLFALFAIVASVAWQRSPLGRQQPTSHENLNARMNTYLGRRGVAADNFVAGHGAILLDDTRWAARVGDDSAPVKGDVLQVMGADGTLLTVRALSTP
jgi:membrane protein implicated in regulation of membrane protease activity